MKTTLTLTLIHRAALLLLLSTLNSQLSTFAQGTAFTYQGRLNDGASIANGIYDLRFTIYDSTNLPGTVIAGPLTNSATVVSNGLFTATLDFGAIVFDGSPRWLEIGARPAGSGAFATLSPRQRLTSSPYAVRALSAGSVPNGAITSAMIANGAVTAPKIAPGAVSQLGTPNGSDPDAVQVGTNGLVGIGSTNPAAGLHITAASSMLGANVLFQVQDGTGSYTNLANAWSATGSGNLLAVSGISDDAVMLLDVSNPVVPIVRFQIKDGIGAITNLDGAGGLVLSSNLLVVAARFDHAVTLIDVSTPTNPVWRAALRDGFGGFNELNGAYDVALNGSLLAVAAVFDDAVTLVDVSNPASPILRAVMKDGQFGFNDLDTAVGVSLSGNLLAITAVNESAVTLVDVSNPASPVLRALIKDGVGGFNDLGGAYAAVLSSNLLAIAAGVDNAVTLVDVSNPASPVLLAVLKDGVGYDGLAFAWRLAISGNLLAIASYGESAVTLVDVSAPINPVLRGVFRNGLAGIYWMSGPGGLAFVNGNLAVPASIGHSLTLLQPAATPVSLATQGRVGIGTVVPAAALHVVGNVVVEGATTIDLRANKVALGENTLATGFGSTAMGNGSTASGARSTAMGNGTTASGTYSTALGGGTMAIGFAATTMGVGTIASGDYSLAAGFNSAASNAFAFAAGRQAKAVHDGAFVWADSTPADFASTGNNQFLIRAQGGVGINLSQPGYPLHIGSTLANDAINVAGQRSVIENATVNGRAAFLALAGTGGTFSPNRVELQLEASDAERRAIIGTTSEHEVQFRMNNGEVMKFWTNGFVGIGTASPQTLLDVAGTARMSGFRLPTGAQAGRLLQSDGAGNGSWQTAPFSPWQSAGGDIFFSGGYVGIGVNPPTVPLDVNGGARVRANANTHLLFMGGSDDAWLDFIKATTTTPSGRILFNGYASQSEHRSRIEFYTRGLSDPGLGLRLTVEENGSVQVYSNLSVLNPATLDFGASVRQMINLWGTAYGVGVQSGTTYFRTGGGFGWYLNGVHNDGQTNAGAGGTRLMLLDSSGNLRTVSGTIATISDRNAKTNFATVDGRDVLEKVARLPIETWNLKTHDPAQRHIGPMAQDFYAAFGVGLDDTSICTVDADGVALAAIQGLNEKVEVRMQNAEVRSRKLEEKLEQKELEITELKQRLEKLEKLMNQNNRGAQ